MYTLLTYFYGGFQIIIFPSFLSRSAVFVPTVALLWLVKLSASASQRYTYTPVSGRYPYIYTYMSILFFYAQKCYLIVLDIFIKYKYISKISRSQLIRRIYLYVYQSKGKITFIR